MLTGCMVELLWGSRGVVGTWYGGCKSIYQKAGHRVLWPIIIIHVFVTGFVVWVLEVLEVLVGEVWVTVDKLEGLRDCQTITGSDGRVFLVSILGVFPLSLHTPCWMSVSQLVVWWGYSPEICLHWVCFSVQDKEAMVTQAMTTHYSTY